MNATLAPLPRAEHFAPPRLSNESLIPHHKRPLSANHQPLNHKPPRLIGRDSVSVMEALYEAGKFHDLVPSIASERPPCRP